MVILTDLSEVLIHGISGAEDIAAARYGKDVADACLSRHLEIEEDFRELLRGGMAEDDYWCRFMQEGKWPFGIQELKAIFSENLQKTIPGTLEVYQRIVSSPCSLRNPDSMAQSGIPEIYLVSDHIAERIDELHDYHPDIFAVISKEFWSCEIGRIKMDPGFFPQLLRSLDLSSDEAIFIDDNANNTTAAALAGISSIRFENPTQLKTVLGEYGFQFAP